MTNELEISFMGDYYTHYDVKISSEKEHWSVAMGTLEKDHSPKEVTEFVIDMPNGKTWKGSMQDFMGIFDYSRNALAELRGFASAGCTDPADQQETDHTIIELETLLSHVK